MNKIIFIALALIQLVSAEGYYCPYSELGSSDGQDLLYDYYQQEGDHYVRMGTTGFQSRESYCSAKGDLYIHSDAGEVKCEDSQGTCFWTGSACAVNVDKQPDCKQLCQTILDGGGLACLGNCPGGNGDRSVIYAICDGVVAPTETSMDIPTETSSVPSRHRHRCKAY